MEDSNSSPEGGSQENYAPVPPELVRIIEEAEIEAREDVQAKKDKAARATMKESGHSAAVFTGGFQEISAPVPPDLVQMIEEAEAALERKLLDDEAEASAGGKKRGRSNAAGAPPPVLVFTQKMKDENRRVRKEEGHHPGPTNDPEAGMAMSLDGEGLCTFYALAPQAPRISEQSEHRTVYKNGSLAYALYTSAGKTFPLNLTVEKLKQCNVWEGVLVIKLESQMSPEERANFQDIVGNNDYQYGLLDGMKEKFDELVKKAFSAREARNPNTGSYTFFIEEKEGDLLSEYDSIVKVWSAVEVHMEKGTRLCIDYIRSGENEGVPWLGGRITIIAVENSESNDFRKKYRGTEGRPKVLARLIKEYDESLNRPTYYVTENNELRNGGKLLNKGKPYSSISGLVIKEFGSQTGLRELKTKINLAGLGATAGSVSRWVDKDSARSGVVEWSAPNGKTYTIRGHNEA